MTTLRSAESTNRSPVRRSLLLITLAVACFALAPAPKVFAVSPPPDGGYPGGNTAEGTDSLLSLTSGGNNTAVGDSALSSNTTGFWNTATGYQALLHSNGGLNTATGARALWSNTTGVYNTATGASALFYNTNGKQNTATGAQALTFNTTGVFNTANGAFALFFNTTGGFNTATGLNALKNNTSGQFNTADGALALFSNTNGNVNTANGYQALYSNTGGSRNTALGFGALYGNTTGIGNIALGISAGGNLTTGNNNIDIGNAGVAGDSGKIRIGEQGVQTATYFAGISGVNEGGTISAVYINTDGQLGTQPPASSRRYKKDIKPMDKVSEAILALKPVTFQYKSDNKGVPQFGLIAEDVAAVNPNLVVRDKDGEIYTVRYDAVNAMLLNEFLKEHRKVEKQETTISQLESTVAKQESTAAKQEATIARQQKDIEALTVGLQKVTDQLALSKPAPRTVLNHR
jgi:uncharacterized coiled-coil protein SlyX